MNDILDDIQENEDHDEEDWQNYLGEHADYYIPIWQKIQSGQIIIFNIYSFLFGMFWMLYRKMYRATIIVGIIFTFQIVIEEILRINGGMSEDELNPISWIISLIWWIVLGLYGNYFFYIDAQQKISASKKLVSEYYNSQLQEIGGTSILSLMAGIVIYFAIIALSTFIISMYYNAI